MVIPANIVIFAVILQLNIGKRERGGIWFNWRLPDLGNRLGLLMLLAHVNISVLDVKVLLLDLILVLVGYWPLDLLVNEFLGVVQVVPYLLLSFHVLVGVSFEWTDFMFDWDSDVYS